MSFNSFLLNNELANFLSFFSSIVSSNANTKSNLDRFDSGMSICSFKVLYLLNLEYFGFAQANTLVRAVIV